MADGTLSNTPHGDDSARNNTSNTEQSQPAGSGAIGAQEQKKSTHRHTQSCHTQTPAKWWHRIDWSQVVLDLLLLLVGIRLAFIYSGQLDAMIRANCINNKTAAAAKSASDTAVQTMHIDTRGWINVSTGTAAMVDGAPLVLPMTIDNEGKTAVLNLSARMVINVLPVKEEPDLRYYRGHPSYGISIKAMLPNHPHTSPYAAFPKYHTPGSDPTPINVTPTLRDRITKGKVYIVMHLRVEYDDIFGVHHWLQYCGHGETATPGTKAKSAGATCGDYNDVDRNF
jgi:hypothetical protein